MDASFSRIPSNINASLDASQSGHRLQRVPLQEVLPVTDTVEFDGIATSWACRAVEPVEYGVWTNPVVRPEAGDVAVFRVEKIGHHQHLRTKERIRLKLSRGDLFVGVFGNRYATDAYEGIVAGADVLHLLTASGMVGTLLSKHDAVAFPTRVGLTGYLARSEGGKLNLRRLLFRPEKPGLWAAHLLLFAGAGMNTGKTTAAISLVRGLVAQGLRVAICKLTGSVSPGDRDEMTGTRAHDVRDFSDYGFPSTYFCTKQELRDLFDTMLADTLRIKPDLVVMEVADGLLQRETTMVLEDRYIRKRVDGVILTAACSMSALEGVNRLRRLGHRVAAVAGTMTRSPLYIREFCAYSDVPVCYSTSDGEAFASLMMKQLIPYSL